MFFQKYLQLSTFLFVHCLQAEVYNIRYNLNVSSSFGQAYLMHKVQIRDLVSCLVACNVNSGCLSLSFREFNGGSTENCFLYKRVFVSSDIVNTIGTNYFYRSYNTSYTNKSISNLFEGESLHSDDTLYSTNGQCKAIMQTDGNFVVYSLVTPLWSTNTITGSDNYLALQYDGNLVLYDSTGVQLWSSNSNLKGVSPFRLELQNDCNIVIYDGNSVLIWSMVPCTLFEGGIMYPGDRLYSLNRQCKAIMQTDGNFVLYNLTTPIWNTNTAAINSSNRITLKNDGNLVLRDLTGGVQLWSSNSSFNGVSIFRLELHNDCNLVIYDGNNNLIWTNR